MAIWLYERVKIRYGWQTLAVLATILPTVMVAESISVDFGGFGVLLLFAMYAIIPKIPRLIVMSVLVLPQFMMLAMAYTLGMKLRWEYLLMIPFALITMPLIALHNGERGRQMKWLFYVAYPAHLVVLAVVAVMINGM